MTKDELNSIPALQELLDKSLAKSRRAKLTSEKLRHLEDATHWMYRIRYLIEEGAESSHLEA